MTNVWHNWFSKKKSCMSTSLETSKTSTSVTLQSKWPWWKRSHMLRHRLQTKSLSLARNYGEVDVIVLILIVDRHFPFALANKWNEVGVGCCSEHNVC